MASELRMGAFLVKHPCMASRSLSRAVKEGSNSTCGSNLWEIWFGTKWQSASAEMVIGGYNAKIAQYVLNGNMDEGLSVCPDCHLNFQDHCEKGQ
jgi:hypothetical protein